MSSSDSRQVTCPGCGAVSTMEVATSLNAARAIEPLDAIYESRFQELTCSACGQRYQVEWPFLLYDFSEKVVIGVFPVEWQLAWRTYEALLSRSFGRTLGDAAPALARSIGDGFFVRTVFGQAALREKLLCRAVGIDDRLLEALKLELVRSEGAPLDPSAPARLISLDGEELVLALGDERWHVPRAAWDALVARAPRYQAVLTELGRTSFVDVAAVISA
jgi:hypothetical protein